MPEEIKTIAQVVASAVAKCSGIKPETVDMEKTFHDQPDGTGTSLDLVECFMDLEDATGLSISDAAADSLRGLPLREWVAYIEQRRAAGAA